MHFIIQTKYYDDYNWFQIYTNRADYDNGSVSLTMPVFYGDFHYGLRSGGNIYDILPLSNNVVQFWTHEYDGVTYCVVLQKYTLLYAQQVFVISNDDIRLVKRSLFFDEAHGVDISFSRDLNFTLLLSGI